MPTTYNDQFFVMDPGNPPPNGTALVVQRFNFVDQNDNGFISPSGNDSFNGIDITSVWVNDTIRVIMNGVTVNITGVTFYTAGGPAVFTPTDGTVLSNATFLSSTWVPNSTQIPVGAFGPPCFVAGTLIDTPDGPRAVEEIGIGDLVLTRDHGAQEVRWTGHRQVAGTGDFAPIRFAPDALGNTRALLVSPQHRMLIAGWRAELYCGADEVLIAATHLVNGDTIHRMPMAEVSYHHLMFDDHEIILSEGIPSESFHPGDYILMADAGIRAELLALFPDLNPLPGHGGRRTARPVARGAEARVLQREYAPLA